MTFDASKERAVIDAVVLDFRNEISQPGGSIVAEKLQSTINDTWCKLDPAQQIATANAAGSSRTEFEQDGNSAFFGINYENTYFFPLDCSASKK